MLFRTARPSQTNRSLLKLLTWKGQEHSWTPADVLELLDEDQIRATGSRAKAVADFMLLETFSYRFANRSDFVCRETRSGTSGRVQHMAREGGDARNIKHGIQGVPLNAEFFEVARA